MYLRHGRNGRIVAQEMRFVLKSGTQRPGSIVFSPTMRTDV
ncbi:MAG: hypothetical protein PWQ41_1673 [Bacillota bacterium]|nr:hypothetical protein [Bacillota bacterium]MDK2925899.1 hypothetical protein [Bacillota bacterium]